MADLERTCRARLGFTGAVTMQSVPPSELVVEGIGTTSAVTTTNEDLSKHLIKYAKDVRIEDYVFFHEFCRVKLNEIGFKRAEALLEGKIADCCTSDSEVTSLRAARALVAATLADSMLYRFFPAETEDIRSQFDYSFLMVHSLRTLVRKYGPPALTQAAAFRVSKSLAGLGDQPALGKAIEEAFGTSEASNHYFRTFQALSGLPQVGGEAVIEQLDDAEVKAIVDCALSLFEIKTGKKCK